MSTVKLPSQFVNGSDDIVTDELKTVSKANYDRLKYPQWAPTWEKKFENAFTNKDPFQHTDRGFFGDPAFESLLANKSVETRPISPKLGTEVSGIQLSTLTDKQKDDLALLVEKRGVVIFRDQDLKDLSQEDILTWAKYFGPLHVHPTSWAPKGQPNFHMVFRREGTNEAQQIYADKLNNIVFHSDVSYELQPPGVTLLAMLQTDRID
ncbi:unnamed protein product [Ambrosiozyma monospora]|uniref:Unnamed protein product n=1 Tax=Ambrosiozyma monospora TaxID=43982 RepID=A0ACB5TZP2_AMBMO|nr:unnamed protein product [Ambrosiozyma monospora]